MENIKNKLTVLELLKSESFVNSILKSDQKAKEYWFNLIARGDLDLNTYNQARNLTIQIHSESTSYKVNEERLNKIWKKIEATNATQKRTKIVPISWRIIIIAASIIFAVTLYNLEITEPYQLSFDNISLADIESKKHDKDIQLILSDQKSEAIDNKSTIDYTHKGKVKVNNKEFTSSKSAINELIVPYGKRSFLILSDGTKLWVNAGSRVIYPSIFNNKERQILVEGEVYAEVAPDKSRPFYINSKNLSLKVLGTSFNIKDYNSDDIQSVVLITGMVEVSAKSQVKSVLKPNQEFVLLNNNEVIREVDIEEHISWIKGYYKFKNTSISDILTYLSHYYGVEISCEENVCDIRCTGGLDLKESIDSVLHSLILATKGLEVKHSDNAYFINLKPLK